MIRNEEWSTMRRLLLMHGAMGAPLKEYEVEGNPAVFQTNVAKPFAGFTIPLLPVQSGTGDPSPSNVRPISGWTGVTAYLSPTDESDPDKQTFSVTFPAVGKNLFDKNNVDSGKLWWKGEKQAWNGGNASGLIPVIPGQAYTLSRTNPVQNQVMYFDESGAYIDQKLTWSNAQSTNTIPNGVYFVAFNVEDDSLDTAQFERGSTATVYEPYTNTVYGGTIDAVNGVLTVTHKCVSLNDPDKWTKPSGNFIYDEYFNDRKQNYRENDVCSCFRTNSRGYPYMIWAGKTLNRYACYPGSTGLSIDDVKALAEANAIFCVYELAEPIEIPLDPITVQTLIGDNTIWTDTNGENTIRYKKKG